MLAVTLDYIVSPLMGTRVDDFTVGRTALKVISKQNG
jgi:hypothetical protein